MRSKYLFFFLSTAFFLLLTAGIQAQESVNCKKGGQEESLSLHQIIELHAQAMGGREAWRNLQSYELHSSSANGRQTISYAQKPNKMRYDFLSPAGKVIKAYDGQNGWLSRNGQLEDMRPGEAIEMAEEPEFYEELIFAEEKGHELQLLGMESLPDQCVFIIQLIKSPTDTQSYWINTDTYLPHMTGEYSEDPAHAGIYYKTTFDDYREVDGLMFPFKMELIANDRTPIPFSYNKIKLNVDIPDNFFTCPKSRK